MNWASIRNLNRFLGRCSFDLTLIIFQRNCSILVTMLRNGARTVASSKQALMADHHSHSSQAPSTRPLILISPRFKAFTTKGFSETESIMSPTSTIDPKQFLFTNPNPRFQKIPRSPKRVGLAIVDSFGEDPVGQNGSKPRNHNQVLFGSELKIQIPKSDFSPIITLKEMELSEEYTCVTSRGPNPRTTHIFGNCVVESFPEKSVSCSPNKNKLTSILSYCHTCSKNLELKNDIFIYRGDKAFCSEDCRSQEMILDGVEN